MADSIDRIVADCGRYWLDTNVPRPTVQEMKAELETHLREAAAEGRDPEQVVGRDVAAFAEEWARETRLPGFNPPATTRGPDIRRWTYTLLASLTLIVAVVAMVTAGQGDSTENETWRWVWTVGAVVLASAEIFTAGFFLLPFGFGAGAAAILAWINSPLVVQWLGG